LFVSEGEPEFAHDVVKSPVTKERIKIPWAREVNLALQFDASRPLGEHDHAIRQRHRFLTMTMVASIVSQTLTTSFSTCCFV
jgi:hypothetical protein